VNHLPKPSKRPRSILLELFAAQNRAARLLRSAMAGAPLTPDEFAVYSLLHVVGTMTPAAIARALGMQRPTLSNYLRRMADRDDLDRAPNPSDGRSAHVQLSASGHAKVHEAERSFGLAIRALQANLKIPREDVIGALVSLNSTLEAALKAVGEGADSGGRPPQRPNPKGSRGTSAE
jgi:DNA-binding MarR family transcriptional regulator